MDGAFLAKLLGAAVFVFGLMALWVTVQAAARRAAREHPEAGPYQEAGSCGGGCGHCAEACDRPAAGTSVHRHPVTVHHR